MQKSSIFCAIAQDSEDATRPMIARHRQGKFACLSLSGSRMAAGTGAAGD
ncbi:hypothetical protein [Bradyrhizobium diversitatis]|uniref:Uncharacterized protein n=1 Tax=Bradyrhizobium diversitatis TaxID=2755406 RepID=A0ABS0PBG0_9BRAD|nr:hypothetical protein [Bradyrhizobium diversitatis]MBH5390634.1 hypothetical protein [Bradyrhizobium diversitatis]